jgi:hypothetical protein
MDDLLNNLDIQVACIKYNVMRFHDDGHMEFVDVCECPKCKPLKDELKRQTPTPLYPPESLYPPEEKRADGETCPFLIKRKPQLY